MRDGDDWVVTGTKAWITHGGRADFYNVFCRTGGPGASGISCLLADADTPGLIPQAPERTMGLRSSPPAQIVFDGARVPADRLIGAEGTGFRIAMQALDAGRLGIAACAVGLAQAALDYAAGYAREREQFGRPIAEFQGIGFMLADMATQVSAARGADAVRGAAQGRRPAVLRRGGQGQAVRHRRGDAGDHRRGPGARRVRLCRRPPGRALVPGGQGAADRRGHQPDPAAGDQPVAGQGLRSSSGHAVMLSAVEEIDRAIVGALTADGRLSYTDLAERVGLSVSAVHQRVRRLEQRGVIKGYTRQGLVRGAGPAADRVRGDPPVRPVAARRRPERLAHLAEIDSCYSVAGEDFYLLLVRVASPADLERLLQEIRTAANVTTRTTVVLSTPYENRPPRIDIPAS